MVRHLHLNTGHGFPLFEAIREFYSQFHQGPIGYATYHDERDLLPREHCYCLIAESKVFLDDHYYRILYTEGIPRALVTDTRDQGNYHRISFLKLTEGESPETFLEETIKQLLQYQARDSKPRPLLWRKQKIGIFMSSERKPIDGKVHSLKYHDIIIATTIEIEGETFYFRNLDMGDPFFTRQLLLPFQDPY